MNISSTISTTKEKKASGLPVRKDSPLDKRAGIRAKTRGTTGTFVYLKTRKGIKSRSAQEAAEEWQPKMWTYLR